MKWFHSLFSTLLIFSVVAAGWSVKDGSISIIAKDTPAKTQEFSEIKDLTLNKFNTLKVKFQSLKNGVGSKAHQTAVQLQDLSNPDLQFMFTPNTVRPNGRTDISISHKSIPTALQGKQLSLTLLIASFGNDKPLKLKLSDSLFIEKSEELKQPSRLTTLPELRHTFRPPPKTVSSFIAIFFLAIAILLLLVLVIFWSTSTNISSISTAFSNSPLGHIGLLLSLLSFEIIFFRYFQGTNIFDTLLSIAVVSPIAIFTGSRALREVRQRRLNGQFN